MLEKIAVDIATNKKQGLDFWNLQGRSDILIDSIADSKTYQKEPTSFIISKGLVRVMLYFHCLYHRT